MELSEALRVFYKEAARLWHALEALRAGVAEGAPALQPLLQALKALDVIVEHAASQALASHVKALVSAHTRYSLQAEFDWQREQYALLTTRSYNNVHYNGTIRVLQVYEYRSILIQRHAGPK